MRNRSPATAVIESASPLPPELEARIAELETDRAGADFDRRSWFWMIVFGVVLPVVLLVIGSWE
jgi:hypothetical protein